MAKNNLLNNDDVFDSREKSTKWIQVPKVCQATFWPWVTQSSVEDKLL